jgi:Xaa-Pro aminopeptidase
MDFSRRRKRLGGAGGHGIMLTTSPRDILYYTGYEAEGSLLMVRRDGSAALFTNRLENEAETIKGVDVEFIRDVKDVKGYVRGSAGYNEDYMRAQTVKTLRKIGVLLKPAADAFAKIRAVKDEEELEAIRKAVSITRHAFDARVYGKSEIEVARDIVCRLMSNGSDTSLPYEPIVASGPNSYFIHHPPSGRKIRKDELVIQDSAARYRGYCADVTRTYSEGCGHEQKKIVDDVLEIKSELTDFIECGITMKQAQKKYKQLTEKRRRSVMHGFGHGVGLDVHELVPGKLEKGMVITLEPGIYEKNIGGCRVEDMLLITRSKPKILTKTIPCR